MIDADHVIEEIRESRRQMSRECNHDVREYIAYLKTLTPKFQTQVDLFQKSHGPSPARSTARR